MKLKPTLVDEMKYALVSPKNWRFVHTGDGWNSIVGPIYPTKELLLADMRRYLLEWGYNI